MSRTVAVVLANEPGSGFSGSKFLVDVGGGPLIDRVLADISRWPVDDTVVVLGPDAEEILQGMEPTDATVVMDLEWSEGSAASLRVGRAVVRRGTPADLGAIALADQPGVGAEDVEALIDAASDASASVPKYRYRRGFPVVLERSIWERLLGAEGDLDLLDLLESHPEGVQEVWFEHLSGPRIRTPDDIRQR